MPHDQFPPRIRLRSIFGAICTAAALLGATVTADRYIDKIIKGSPKNAARPSDRELHDGSIVQPRAKIRSALPAG
jgi:hypothetical protein